MLIIDLGQSGSRYQIGQDKFSLSRGKLSGEDTLEALSAVFKLIHEVRESQVILSCTGFYGEVSEPEKYLNLCAYFFGAKEVAVIDDGLAGFMGALRRDVGVVLTLGGGVVSIGGNKGVFVHRDGLGSTFGDEGGGYWLGKLAITKALGIRQGRGLDQKMLEYFSQECEAFDALVIKNSADAATLAIQSAKKVLEAADAGSTTAMSIVDEGAFLLAQTVAASWIGCGGSQTDSPEIVIQGGLAQNASYSTKISQEILQKLPHARIIQPIGDNLDGAAWIAQNMLEDAPPLLRWAR